MNKKITIPQVMVFITITVLYFCLCDVFVVLQGINTKPQQKAIYFKQTVIDQNNQPKTTTDSILGKNNFTLGYTNASGGHVTVPSNQLFFQKNPKFLLYLFLIFALSSISAGLCVPVFIKLCRIIKMTKNKGMSVLLILFAIVLNIVFHFTSRNNPNVWYPEEILQALNLLLFQPQRVMGILILPPVILEIMVESGLFISAYHLNTIKPVHHLQHEFFHIYRAIKRDINQYLSILALIAGAGTVITITALENAVNESFTGNTHFIFMPKELSIVYALMSTFFIMIIYAPVHYMVLEKGRSVIALLNPLNSGDFHNWKATQIFLEEHIEVKSGFKENMFDILLILSPILASLIAQQMPK